MCGCLKLSQLTISPRLLPLTVGTIIILWSSITNSEMSTSPRVPHERRPSRTAKRVFNVSKRLSFSSTSSTQPEQTVEKNGEGKTEPLPSLDELTLALDRALNDQPPLLPLHPKYISEILQGVQICKL